MAFQGKGILGTPSGKVASLMFYERNGKGIVQHVPRVVNKKERLSNLFPESIKKALVELWSSLPNVWRVTFGTPYFANDDYFENYMALNESRWRIDRNPNINNLYITYGGVAASFEMIFDMDYNSNVLRIALPSGVESPTGLKANRIYVRSWDENFVYGPVVSEGLVSGMVTVDLNVSSLFSSQGEVGFGVFVRFVNSSFSLVYSLDKVENRL